MKKRLLNKSTQKLLSVMLASAMLFVSPMSVIGEGLTIGQIGADDNATLVDPTDSFYEDVAMRDEFSKHYVLESGERYAVIFPEAVHYDDGGEWKEVDNRLTYNVATGKYVSANPKFTAAFADNAASGELVSISDGEHTVSWGISFAKNSGGELMNVSASGGQISVTNGADTAEKLADAKAAQASIARASAETSQVFDKEAAEATYKNAVTDIGKASSGISYANVMGEAVSFRYSVAHGKVEEDIILRSKSDLVSYTMTVNTGGLVLTANEDGSVSFKTADGETFFVIDAPWMKDSAYGFSKDIDVVVTQTGNTATVTYTPSAEWLNSPDRAYPVFVDSMLTSDPYTNCFEDTHILSGETDFTYHSNSTTLYVGMSPIGEWTTYIKITYFPNFNDQDVTISDGSLVVCTPYQQNYPLNLYETTSSWCGQTYAQIPTIEPISGERFSWYNETYGKYSYNLYMMELFNKINTNYDGDYNDYFSNVYDGFMINSFSSASDEVTQLDSTEAGTATPMMTLEYTVNEGNDFGTIDSCIVDDGIYNIQSNASKNYLTVYNGAETVVHQSALNDSDAASQSFNFIYCGNGKYKIRWGSSVGGILGFDYADVDANGVANIKLYDDIYDEDYNLYWRIEFTSSTEVKIVSYTDPDLVLSIDHDYSENASGTTITSADIIVKQVQTSGMTESQIWQIWSGGNIIWNVDDISKSTAEILSIGDTLRLNSSITSLGNTVTWSSSDNSIATVTQNGRITPMDIGTVTITASEGANTQDKSITLMVVAPGANEYCFKTTSGQKAMCLDYDTNDICLSDWSASEEQIWTLVYYNDGYYTIQHSTLGCLTAPILYSSENVLLRSIPSTGPLDTQLWKITTLDNGNYKIQSKYYEFNDLVLSRSNDTQGSIIIKDYTDDSDYRDEWSMTKRPCTLKINIYADLAYRTRHPNYSTVRIPSYMEDIKQILLDEFNILIQYTSVIDIYSYADTCDALNHQTLDYYCDHTTDEECRNSSFSEESLENYHHNNHYNIIQRIGLPDTSMNTKLVFLGCKTCEEDYHNYDLNGLAWEYYGVSVITNFSSELSERKTVLHELLHWYGAPDHYNGNYNDMPSTNEINQEKMTENFNRICMFGEDKETPGVLQNLIICEGCKSIIRQNFNKYNH